MAVDISRKLGNMFKRRTSNASHKTTSPLRTSTQSSQGSQDSHSTTETGTSSAMQDFAQQYTKIMRDTDINEQNPENYTLKYSEDRSEAIPLPQELQDELPRMKSLIKDMYEYGKVKNVKGTYYTDNISEALKAMKASGADFTEEDIIFAQNWVDQVEKFIRAKGEELVGSHLQETHDPFTIIDVTKNARDFHTDNPERQGELAAAVGLSAGCTEIIPLQDKRKLIGHKKVFDHTKENIKAASRAVKK